MNRNSNKKRILTIGRIFTTFCAIVAFVASCYAWFAVNKETAADGMGVEVNASANMVIATSSEAIRSSTSSSIIFSGACEKLRPATHDWNSIGGIENNTGLVFNTNPEEVDPTTGLNAGTGLSFSPVPIIGTDPNNSRRYYRDYVICVGSREKAMIANDLRLSFGYLGDDPPSVEQPYFNAASVDVYVDEICENNYRGTLNIAHKNYQTLDDQEEISLLEAGKESITIPLNTLETDNCIPIYLRFYFDGGLKSSTSATSTYIHSAGLTTAKFNIAIKLRAVLPGD